MKTEMEPQVDNVKAEVRKPKTIDAKDKPFKQVFPDLETRIQLRKQQEEKLNRPDSFLVRIEPTRSQRNQHRHLNKCRYFSLFLDGSNRIDGIIHLISKRLGVEQNQTLHFFGARQRLIRRGAKIRELIAETTEQDGILYLEYAIYSPGSFNFRLPPMRKLSHLLGASLLIFAAVFSLNYFLPLTISLITVTLGILALICYKFFTLIAEHKNQNPSSRDEKLTLSMFLLFALWFIFCGVSPDDYKKKNSSPQPKQQSKTVSNKNTYVKPKDNKNQQMEKCSLKSTKLEQQPENDSGQRPQNNEKLQEKTTCQTQGNQQRHPEENPHPKSDGNESSQKTDNSSNQTGKTQEKISDADNEPFKKVFPELLTRKKLLLHHELKVQKYGQYDKIFIRVEPYDAKQWPISQKLYYNYTCATNFPIIKSIDARLRKQLGLPVYESLFIVSNKFEILSKNTIAKQLRKEEDGLVYLQYSKKQPNKFKVFTQKFFTKEFAKDLIKLLSIPASIYWINLFLPLGYSLFIVTIAIFILLLRWCYGIKNKINNMAQQERLSWGIFIFFIIGLIFYKPKQQNQTSSAQSSNQPKKNIVKDEKQIASNQGNDQKSKEFQEKRSYNVEYQNREHNQKEESEQKKQR